MLVLSGSSNRQFFDLLVRKLGVEAVNVDIKRFSDQETSVEIKQNVRGGDVFLVQSTCYPANENIMELLICIDALKRASAKRITAVIPYFGYARQDRKATPRAPISAKLVANLITIAGADRVLTIDLHSPQIQGFFDIPLDNLYAHPVFRDHIQNLVKKNNLSMDDVAMVSPDAGGVIRARYYAKSVGCGMVIIDKRREQANTSEVMHVIGEVKNKLCIIVDDIIDTAGTMCNAAEALKKNGALDVYAYATHPVLSGSAISRINASCMKKVFVGNTIPLIDQNNQQKIEQIDFTDLFAKAMNNIATNNSLSSLFE